LGCAGQQAKTAYNQSGVQQMNPKVVPTLEKLGREKLSVKQVLPIYIDNDTIFWQQMQRPNHFFDTFFRL